MSAIAKYVFCPLYYISLLFFSYLMVLITIQYVPIDFNVAFLRIKEDAIAHLHYQIAFFSHVYTSIFVLFLGLSQFSHRIRRRFPWLHRSFGVAYVLLVIVVASPSGLIMAFYANGGIFAKLSFSIQAILWFYFTLQAYRYAKIKNWQKHKNFMMRSYALTLSAISLRLFKWIIVHTFALPPMDTYRIVSWMGWLVNILIVELYIYLKPQVKGKYLKNTSIYN